jgi:hypothetical protein
VLLLVVLVLYGGGFLLGQHLLGVCQALGQEAGSQHVYDLCHASAGQVSIHQGI